MQKVCSIYGTKGLLQYRIYPIEINLELKFHEILFAHNPFLSCPIISKFCTEHGSDAAMLCAKFWNDFTTEIDVMHKKVFTIFEFLDGIRRDILFGKSPQVSALLTFKWHFTDAIATVAELGFPICEWCCQYMLLEHNRISHKWDGEYHMNTQLTLWNMIWYACSKINVFINSYWTTPY